MGRAGRCSNRRELKPDPGAQSYSSERAIDLGGLPVAPNALEYKGRNDGIEVTVRHSKSRMTPAATLILTTLLSGKLGKRPRTCTVRSPGSMENTEVLFDLSLPRSTPSIQRDTEPGRR